MNNLVMPLNDRTFMMMAWRSYSNPRCIASEFEEDLSRIKYIRRLIRKYMVTGELSERLILNHIIIMGNVFGVENAVRMLFFRMKPPEYPVLKEFLSYLGYLPLIVQEIKGKNIITDSIDNHSEVFRILKENIG